MKKIIFLLLLSSLLVSLVLRVPYGEAVKKVVSRLAEWVEPGIRKIPSSLQRLSGR